LPTTTLAASGGKPRPPAPRGEVSVSEKSNREVVETYAKAQVDHDYDAMDQLRHADYVCEYP